MNLLLSGMYSARMTDARGNETGTIGWRSNVVVQRCSHVLAALVKGHPGMGGNLYWAIGAGVSAWDPGPPPATYTATTLHREVYRQPIAGPAMVYLDSANQPIETVTNRLEIKATFRGKDIAPSGSQALREFGLFGGDASRKPGSGILINYVIHPRKDMTAGMTLDLTLRLSFITGGLLQGGLGGFGAALPVSLIDGIGPKYAEAFTKAGVRSLSDLVRSDPETAIGAITKGRLREFRAKARLVMGLQVDLSPFLDLSGMNLLDLLMEGPGSLAQRTEKRIAPETIAGLQEQLSVLLVALDNERLKHVNLGDLIS